jgi:hypothetical protein
MRIGEILIGQGLCTSADIDAAVAHQREHGGRLGTSLVALKVLTVEQLLSVLRGQQEADSALQLCEHTLRRWQGSYGPAHPNTHRARYNLARALLIAGRATDSVAHAEAAFAGHVAALGPDHPWTQESRQLAADVREAAARISRGEIDAAPAAMAIAR